MSTLISRLRNKSDSKIAELTSYGSLMFWASATSLLRCSSSLSTKRLAIGGASANELKLVFVFVVFVVVSVAAVPSDDDETVVVVSPRADLPSRLSPD